MQSVVSRRLAPIASSDDARSRSNDVTSLDVVPQTVALLSAAHRRHRRRQAKVRGRGGEFSNSALLRGVPVILARVDVHQASTADEQDRGPTSTELDPQTGASSVGAPARCEARRATVA